MIRRRVDIDLEECCTNVQHIRLWTDQQTNTVEIREKLVHAHLEEVKHKYEILQTRYHEAELQLVYCNTINIEQAKRESELQKYISTLKQDGHIFREQSTAAESALKSEVLQFQHKYNSILTRCNDIEIQLCCKSTELTLSEQILVSTKASLQIKLNENQNFLQVTQALQLEKQHLQSLLDTANSKCYSLEVDMKAMQTCWHEAELSLRSCETRNVELTKREKEQVENEKRTQQHESELTHELTSLKEKHDKFLKFGVHVFGNKLSRYVDQDTIQNAGQVGELATLFIIQKLYPDAIIEKVGFLSDTCDLKCTFDPEIDPKVLLVECKSAKMESATCQLSKVSIEKFIENVVNNTKYDGGLLVRSHRVTLPGWTKALDGSKHDWLRDCRRFLDHDNLYTCPMDKADHKYYADEY